MRHISEEVIANIMAKYREYNINIPDPDDEEGERDLTEEEVLAWLRGRDADEVGL